MRIQRFCELLILIILFPLCTIGQTSGRLTSSFDEGWKFHLGNATNPEKDFNYGIANIYSKSGKAENTAIDPKYNDSGWRTVQLPHDWAVELPFQYSDNDDIMAHGYKPIGGLYPENSIGWYRKSFKVNRSDSGNRFVIQFDGIYRDSRIWINGFYLGNNLSGYIGQKYDITDYLNFDKNNVIVVRADASQFEGWFYEGAGIYRHTWLTRYNDLHINPDGIYIHDTINNKVATIKSEVSVTNKDFKDRRGVLYSYITDREGKVLAQSVKQAILLSQDKNKNYYTQLKINAPRLWSIEDPYLYRIITVIKDGNKVIDSCKIRYGIRTINYSQEGLFLNGKHVKIKGVCTHQDFAGVGVALPDYLQYYKVTLLKQLGANALRSSHNPPAPELLDACDSLGLLVMDEQRLLNSSTEYIDQFERMIIRDRNHPSIFLWSIGNEEGYIQTNTIGKRIAKTLLQKQKELDPGRLSSYAADVANVFQGVNEVIPVRGFNYRINGLESYHKDHPNQPIIGTEMGSTVTTRGEYVKDTVKGYLPDEDITAPWWANTAQQWWPLGNSKPWFLGGFIWTGFDYRGEPTPFKWPNINSHFGIMDVCGFPKNIYYYYQSWWKDENVLHISPHWNWKGNEGKPIDVWVNSNADSVTLYLNGKSLGNKVMLRDTHLQWNVNYEPGKLEAIAYKNNNKFNKIIETTGAPSEVVIMPYKTTLLADGKDATIINVHVIDRQGRDVPDADNLIHILIQGDGKIIGCGNGDPSSHEPDKYMDGNYQRKLFNGSCQFILQSGKTQSNIKVEVTSDKLYTGSTDIHTLIPVLTGNNGIYKTKLKAIKHTDKILGADISFLPELENGGIKFSDKDVPKDAISILKDHGFNYIRLRIFKDPSLDSGYSPGKGFCDLGHTLKMAKRIKAAGMKFLLDFHYSDYWADPGKQFKPASWKGMNAVNLQKELYNYTKDVLLKLKDQGTLPDMVQVGNEINHGIVWPDGHISHIDTLAALLNAGIAAVTEVSPSSIIMLHIALGGQHDESVFFLDNMLERGVHFDVIGLSYYPKWHGLLSDLKYNVSELAKKYSQDVIIAEYSQLKEDVNDIIFQLPSEKGRGSFIWEPLSTWEAVFNKDGSANDLINVYDKIHKKYISGK